MIGPTIQSPLRQCERWSLTMADDSNDTKNAKDPVSLLRMRLLLGPPTSTTDPFSDDSDTKEKASPARDPAHVTLRAIGEKFATRLQLLWSYQREIGAVASATSFTNMASVMALMLEVAESAEGRNPEDALAACRFTLVLKLADGSEQTDTTTMAVYEGRHLKSLRDRIKYHDAALRLLHETAIQQLVNAYEQLMSDIVQRHIFRNHASAAAD